MFVITTTADEEKAVPKLKSKTYEGHENSCLCNNNRCFNKKLKKKVSVSFPLFDCVNTIFIKKIQF